MLLWMPSSSRGVASSRPPLSGNGSLSLLHMDEDEKAAKIQRANQQNKYKHCAFLVLSAMLVVAVVTFFPSPDPRRIRTSETNKSTIQQQKKERNMLLSSSSLLSSSLPPESIYRLSVPDGSTPSQEISLAPYAGNVTLVVNTACH